MAQRSYAETIDAIELNPDAFEECVENFENSIWNDRLFCYHGDVKEFAEESDLEYDLILCNPPFFKNELTETISNRNQARKQFSLTYIKLLKCVKTLLTPLGKFSTIIPYNDHQEFAEMAKNLGLFLDKITNIKGHTHSEFKRCLMQFSFEDKPIMTDELVLEISRHKYTDDYKNLVKDFYLKL
jgi:tRNA1Val (adenine37-N6)-methyltransferase